MLTLGKSEIKLNNEIDYALREYPVELFDYQKEAVKFMLENKNAVCGDEMGLGKTFSSIATAITGDFSKVLIVCPASIRATWKKEGLIKFGINRNDIAEIKSPSKIENSVFDKRFIILSYRSLPMIDKRIIEDYKPDMVIFDECNYVKNSKSQRTKSAYFLRKNLPEAKFILLSGTIITGKLKDLLPVFYLCQTDSRKLQNIEGHIKIIEKAERKAKRKKHAFNVSEFKNIFDLVSDFLREIMIRRTKNEIEGLPEKIERLIYVDMTAHERKEYNETLGRYIKETGHEGILSSPAMSLVQSMKWRQFSSILKTKHAKEIIDLLLKKNLKVIIFAHFKESIAELKRIYGDRAVVFDGSQDNLTKQRFQELFKQYADIDIIIANTKTASFGFNWVESSDSVFLDLDWVPTNDWQARDRIHRHGQESEFVYIYYLVLNNSIETDMLDKQFEKTHIISSVLKENNDFNSKKPTTLNKVLREIDKTRLKKKKEGVEYYPLAEEFKRICEIHIEKELKDAGFYDLKEQIKKSKRKATRKQKELNHIEFNTNNFFEHSGKNIMRLYISTEGYFRNRPFITFQPDKSMDYRRGFEKHERYKGFYIYYVIGWNKSDIPTCKAVIDDLIDISGGKIEKMLKKVPDTYIETDDELLSDIRHDKITEITEQLTDDDVYEWLEYSAKLSESGNDYSPELADFFSMGGLLSKKGIEIKLDDDEYIKLFERLRRKLSGDFEEVKEYTKKGDDVYQESDEAVLFGYKDSKKNRAIGRINKVIDYLKNRAKKENN